MLKSLTIENYALIDELHISFSGGLSIITGETGAGKSILLGALSLLLGQRCDTGILKDSSRNCIVEGEFEVEGYGLETIFDENELDYLPQTTIRRIILPSGKSRAFVNDIPVTLNILKELGERLIDIHSQHQNLLLNSSNFQFKILDAQAGNAAIIEDYRKNLAAYKKLQSQLLALNDKASRSKNDYDYLQFQYNELQALNLETNEQQALEDELKQLLHAEEIKAALYHSNNLLHEGENAVDSLLRETEQQLRKIIHAWPEASGLSERVNSCRIELRDIAGEIESAGEKINDDPNRLVFVESRLNAIYALQKKHNVDTVEALQDLQKSIGNELSAIENFDQQIAELAAECEKLLQTVRKLSGKLSENRKKTLPKIAQHTTGMLRTLGMPHAVFDISLATSEQYLANGSDIVQFLFSANKNIPPQEISDVASGGELSRLMLCLKSLLVKASGLPTIIFDEIDTGVSGEVADKMGAIIYELSKNIQVINITHLPQVASKGNAHFVVYKDSDSKGTTTHIKLLTDEERVTEIAKMLSGQNITAAAIANAKELLAVSGE